MRVLIIGGGGREHALAWKASLSSKVKSIFVAPGNAGTAHETKCENIAIAADDVARLLGFAQQRQIDLTIVGPEAPLVLGVADAFQVAGLRCFGPTKNGAQLEGSKAFTKDFLARHGIPTAAYASFTKVKDAASYIKEQGAPIVVKADGLAAGKGVILAQTTAEAIMAAETMLAGGTFGNAGKRVVVEEFLTGEEASFSVMVNGEHTLPLASSQDHKARDDGDKGPNTGGMGAYSPAPVVTESVHARIMKNIIEPTVRGKVRVKTLTGCSFLKLTVRGMAVEGNRYSGFLYAGLMISPDGTPKVLEFNVRFGDPETQPIMMRLQTDLIELIEATLDGKLDRVEARWDPRPALGVVMAAGGYPGGYQKGDVITGLPRTPDADLKVFHAGTDEQDGAVVTQGGRVLCVTALGDNVRAAQARAYQVVDAISWQNVYYRRDIGYRAIEREIA